MFESFLENFSVNFIISECKSLFSFNIDSLLNLNAFKDIVNSSIYSLFLFTVLFNFKISFLYFITSFNKVSTKSIEYSSKD